MALGFQSGALDKKIAENTEPIPFSGCVIWTAAHNGLGYGITSLLNKRVYVHRAVWERHNGPIPDGLRVLHRCDVPQCVNVSHLFLGTQKDNVHDMMAKGRAVRRGAVGTRNASAKLCDDDVRRIRADCRPSHYIAAELGVSGAMVRYVRRGDRWTHVS